jgi:TRAP-type C4-dicarboxylate transport system permease small subunit
MGRRGIMRKFLHLVGNSLDMLSSAGKYLALAAFLALPVFIFAEVVSRYLFRFPLAFVIEISEYLLLVCGLMGAAYLLEVDRHITVDLVVSHLPSHWQRVCSILNSIAGVLLSAVLVWKGWEAMIHIYRNGFHSMGLGVSLFPFYSVIPLASLMLGTQFVARMWKLNQKRDLSRSRVEESKTNE